MYLTTYMIHRRNWGKVYFKSQILVHEYWTILDRFGVPALFASGCRQHVLNNVNITFLTSTGTPEMFQYSPILGRSSKYHSFGGKVYFRFQILVHEYWTILDRFGVPVLFVSGCCQHVLSNVNITFLANTGTPEMFQYSPVLGRSSIWDLKYTFSRIGHTTA